MALRNAARGWLRLSPDEIARAVEDHLREHRRLYLRGSGERCFPTARAVPELLGDERPTQNRIIR